MRKANSYCKGTSEGCGVCSGPDSGSASNGRAARLTAGAIQLTCKRPVNPGVFGTKPIGSAEGGVHGPGLPRDGSGSGGVTRTVAG